MKLSSAEQTLAQFIRAAYLPSSEAAPLPSSTGVDWISVCESARHQSLAPLLYRALKAQGMLTQLPGTLRDDLRMTYFHTAASNLALRNELVRLLECFRREQIRVVLLKGCALVESLYQDMGARPMADLDILIQKSEVTRVSKLLEERDYVTYYELSDGFQRAFENEQAFVRDSLPSVTVDVHWHLLSESYYFERVSMDWFWQQTSEIRIDGEPALVFSPKAQLIYLMSHFVIHHQGEGLRWSFDLALLISRYRRELRWNELIETAHRFGLTRVLQSTLEDVLEVWKVTEVQELLRQTRPNLGERFSFAVFTARHVDARTLWDALSMPTLREKLAYIRHTLLPSASYMQTRYDIADARLVPLYYLWRLAKGFGMFVRSVGSIAANSIGIFRHVRKPQQSNVH